MNAVVKICGEKVFKWGGVRRRDKQTISTNIEDHGNGWDEEQERKFEIPRKLVGPL